MMYISWVLTGHVEVLMPQGHLSAQRATMRPRLGRSRSWLRCTRSRKSMQNALYLGVHANLYCAGRGTTLLCLRETNDLRSTITQVIALGE
jgi:hypothetical protein